MIRDEIDAIVSKRAKSQFMRDILRLRELIDYCGGEITVADIQNLFVVSSMPEKGFFKRLFQKKSIAQLAELDDENNHMLKMAFKVIDELMLEKLTADVIQDDKLRRLYYEHFQGEYEAYELIQYQTRDMLFRKRVVDAIEQAKISVNIEDGNEMI